MEDKIQTFKFHPSLFRVDNHLSNNLDTLQLALAYFTDEGFEKPDDGVLRIQSKDFDKSEQYVMVFEGCWMWKNEFDFWVKTINDLDWDVSECGITLEYIVGGYDPFGQMPEMSYYECLMTIQYGKTN